ncbi:carboxylesterase family protein [Trinickia sp. LjRoot230]|uniref:carboxylesterase/lipase family protein n=1 Tax=Trinickia sp. LjRoot230 TaxID=3342288 RepID=UPI003ECF3D4C
MRHGFKGAATSAIAASLAIACCCLSVLPATAVAQQSAPKVELPDGIIEGASAKQGDATLRVFLGVPYAAAPAGMYRWREPQPTARWAGVRAAKQFGSRCMQLSAPEQVFRSTAMSEDCLYLNIWTPAADERAKLPVLVYFHGGGFDAGDASEGRYDGGHLASRGIVVVTVNYRLGVFGFLAHRDAARESPHASAGNYGLLDQQAALRWVRDNIARFGGAPEQITIGGSSAGAISVSAHMASPLSRGLFSRAIGASGGAFAPVELWHGSEAEQAADEFAQHVGAASLDAMRAMSAEQILNATGPQRKPAYPFWPHIDGFFLTDTPESVFRAGAQAKVPLLLGANSREQHFDLVLNGEPPTPENWRTALKRLFRAHADEALTHYPGGTAEEVMRSGTELAGDLFVNHSIRRWMDLHRSTGTAPVYAYRYVHPRPATVEPANGTAPRHGWTPLAEHGADVPYALGNLRHERQYAWTAEDHDVSKTFSRYIERFVKTGAPNGAPDAALAAQSAFGNAERGNAAPPWPAVTEQRGAVAQQEIGSRARTTWVSDTARHAFMARFFANTAAAPSQSIDTKRKR